MKKAYINLPDSKLYASQYLVKIEYENGEVSEEELLNYSYSNLFEWIKENHEGECDRSVKSITINFIR